jgi:hypothetical protein
MIFIIRNPGTQEKFKTFLPNSLLLGSLIRKPGTQEKFKISSLFLFPAFMASL